MPRKFGKYVVLKEIDRGSMGVVYMAKHPGLGKTVALKALREAHEASKDLVDRFIGEAKAVAKLRHPNIVPVHDVGVSSGVLYFTMDFIEGTTLSELMDRQTLSRRNLVGILVKAARALHYAHGQGIIHRDVKPANILIDRDGTPYLTDFGLAKDLKAEEEGAMKGPIVGTPEYMAPEQAEGRLIDFRADVYGLGAVLYKGLTGRPVFTANTLLRLFEKIRKNEPRPPRRTRPDVPRDLETICLKCLEKGPERRYGSAEELAEDLERFLAGDPILARPPGFFETIGRKARRHRWAILGAFAALLAVAGVYLHLSAAREADVRAARKRLAELSRRIELLESMDLDDMVRELERLAKETGDSKTRERARSLLEALQKRKSAKTARETPAQALKEAQAFLKKHPDLLARAEALFLRVIDKFPDDEAAGSATLALERLAKERRKAADGIFEETHALAGVLLGRKRFGDVLRLWFDVLPELKGTPAEKRTRAQILGAVDQAFSVFHEAARSSETHVEAGAFGKARALLEETLGFGVPEIESRARTLLIALARAREKAREKAEAKAARTAETAGREGLERARARFDGTLLDAFQAVRDYRPEDAGKMLRELARDADMEGLSGEIQARAGDFASASALLEAARKTLEKAAADGGEVVLLIGKPGLEPRKRVVRVEGVEKDRIRVRIMGASTSVSCKEIHPLGWIELALAGRGKEDATLRFGAGLLLHAFQLHEEARPHLRAAESLGLDPSWALARVELACGAEVEERARAALGRCRSLYRAGNLKTLKKALADFRRDFGGTRTALEGGEELASFERALSIPILDVSSMFGVKARALPDGRTELAYAFREKKEWTDWRFGRTVFRSNPKHMEPKSNRVTLDTAAVYHIASFGGDLHIQLEVMLDNPDTRFSVQFQTLYLTYSGNEEKLLLLHRRRTDDRLGESGGKALKKGRWTPLQIERSGGTIRVILGKDVRLSAADPSPRAGSIALHAVTGHAHFRGVRVAGTLDRNWVLNRKRHELRKTKGRAQLLNVSWRTLLGPGRDIEWKTGPKDSWKPERGAWTARWHQVDPAATFTSPDLFFNGAVEARVHFQGEGRFSMDVRHGEGSAVMYIPPGPGIRKLEVQAFGPVLSATLDGLPLRVERRIEAALPGRIRFALAGDGVAVVSSVRMKQGREKRFPRDRWTPLFDGVSLCGWVVSPVRGGEWTVIENMLVGGAERRWNWIRAEDLFRDFRLVLKVKGLEGEGPRVAVRWHGEGFLLTCPPPDGRWHQVEIVAKGFDLKATLDGAPANLVNTDDDGHIRTVGNIVLGVRKGRAAFKDIVVTGMK